MGTLQIDILGTSFAIQAKEDTPYLEKLLAYYTQIALEVEETSHINDSVKIALLSGIMLCDELQKERIKSAELTKLLQKSDNSTRDTQEKNEAERITLNMIQKIDRLLQ